MLCCPCWGTSHFSTLASDHENGKYARSFSVFAVFRRLRLCFLCVCCVSVPCDKSLCGWSGLPFGGAILTVVEENHPVAVVACPVARVMQNCVAQVTSKSTVIGSLVDCPFACRIVADHSLMSGVMHSLAGIMDRKADCVQYVACLFTIYAAA